MNKLGGVKVFQDAIHGLIKVEPLMVRIIDAPEFQRLRFLHQLGISYLVFYCCNHTRFEHCIGTYHLARRLLELFNEGTTDENLRLTNAECIAVKLAALCHDLGHGPYSHFWERFMASGGLQYSDYKHEEMSCRILQRIYDQDEILQQALKECDVNLDLVKALITGDPLPQYLGALKKRAYIFEIINNKLNGIDVDKWEYMMRDCFYLGWGYGFAILELDRFLWFYRPAFFPHSSEVKAEDDSEDTGEWHMSFRDSEIENVLRSFTLRLHLHRQVYSHKVALAIESMLEDALSEWDSILKFRDASYKSLFSNEPAYLSEFLRLTDDYIWNFISGSSTLTLHSLPPNVADKLEKSSKICQRIIKRHLFVNVGCIYVIPVGMKNNVDNAIINSTKISNTDFSSSFPPVIFEKDADQSVAIPIEYLGSHENILQAILAKLPESSPVKSVEELRLSNHLLRSNSTSSEATFYFYSTSGKTFTFTQPLSTLVLMRLLWTGKNNEINSSPPSCLVNSFYEWRKEKQEQYIGSLTSNLID